MRDFRQDRGRGYYSPPAGPLDDVWRFRELSNAKAKGYTIVARTGTTVVRVSVGRSRYPGDGPFTYPQPIAKKKAVSLARIALRTAR